MSEANATRGFPMEEKTNARLGQANNSHAL